MKTFRRIKITACRRRVTILSDKGTADSDEIDIRVTKNDTQDMIETCSPEGQNILITAIRIIERSLQTKMQRD